MKIKLAFLSIILSLLSTNINSQNSNNHLSGPYLGQKLPGLKAEIFAPGIISTGMSTRDIAITPDGKEIYFVVFGPAFTFSTICFTKEVNGIWAEPEVASFAADSKYKYIEPCISYDGMKIFFASNKTSNDSTSGKNDFDIWYAERNGNGWGEAKNLGNPVSTSSPEFFPSLTKEGTIYFTRENENGTNSIMRSKFENGKYSEPEVLPEQINFGVDRFNAFIDPDEKYLIVSVFRAKNGFGATDYYIVFRNADDTWREPINMGDKINTAFNEYSPYVSPDGKYFFFMSMKPNETLFSSDKKFTYDKLKTIHNSPGNGNAATYWIDARVIDELKKSIPYKN